MMKLMMLPWIIVDDVDFYVVVSDDDCYHGSAATDNVSDDGGGHTVAVVGCGYGRVCGGGW